MSAIIFVPALIAAYVAWTRSPAQAFLHVYLPVLFLCPEYYRWVTPGLPDPTFSEATILPIVAIYFFREGRQWRFTVTDVLVAGYAWCVAFAEYLNAGYADAQNLMFDMLATVLFPYVLAKGLIESQGLRYHVGRRMVFLLFCVAVLSMWEFKMGFPLWRPVFDRFFPDVYVGWVTTKRWGFARTAGPYAHAILAGLMMVVGFRLQRWLEWSGAWGATFRWLPNLQVSKARILTGGLFLGALMTLVRGPWMGGVLAAGITAIGRARNRKRAIWAAGIALVLAGIPAVLWFISYVSVGRGGAASLSQETAAYRKELFERYVDIALDHAWWGWGTSGYPILPGMVSVDNHYLLVALRYGFLALACFMLIFIVMAARLGRMMFTQTLPGTRDNALVATLLGVYGAFGLSIATVFMGMQTMPLFFLITGWAEGVLLASGCKHVAHSKATGRVAPFRFARVLQ